AAYAELVLDVRTPRSTLVEGHFIQAIGSPDFERVDKAMQAKYGPNAVTDAELGPPRWVTKLDGKVVNEERISRTFEGVRVIFEIGASKQQTVSTFSIWFAVPSPPDHSSAMVSRRYGFNEFAMDGKPIDYDVVQGPCVVLAAPDLGSVGAAVRLKSGTFCV